MAMAMAMAIASAPAGLGLSASPAARGWEDPPGCYAYKTQGPFRSSAGHGRGARGILQRALAPSRSHPGHVHIHAAACGCSYGGGISTAMDIFLMAIRSSTSHLAKTSFYSETLHCTCVHMHVAGCRPFGIDLEGLESQIR